MKRGRALRVDAAVAVAVGVLVLAGVTFGAHAGPGSLLLALSACALLSARRWAPTTTLALSGGLVLATIADASHEALDELRAVVGVQRERDITNAPLLPAPTLQAVCTLVERARDDGRDVRLDVCGQQPGRLSDALQLAAIRIVQESLTNVQRHAGDAATSVSLRYEHDRLLLTIVAVAQRRQEKLHARRWEEEAKSRLTCRSRPSDPLVAADLTTVIPRSIDGPVSGLVCATATIENLTGASTNGTAWALASSA